MLKVTDVECMGNYALLCSLGHALINIKVLREVIVCMVFIFIFAPN
jgi:hypothetical protein